MKQSKRNYNVFFNVHTVSGIVISIGLFVIFLAGAFALFRNEINQWQYNEHTHANFNPRIDYDRVLAIVENEGFELKGRKRLLITQGVDFNQIVVRGNAMETKTDSISKFTSVQDSLSRSKIYLEIDPKTFEVTSRENGYKGQIGNFIYMLHYFRQIPMVGIYIAGLIAIFFALAILSGVIIHWKKILSNFFTFRLKNSIKNLWTDAHTALGVIGIPFQFMYAITGTYFGLLGLLYLPSFFIVYDGDIENVEKSFLPQVVEVGQVDSSIQKNKISVNTLINKALTDIKTEDVKSIFVSIENYKEPSGKMSITTNHNGVKQFSGTIKSVFRLWDGKILDHKPVNEDYFTATVSTITKLHYAQFGGYFLKILYFILSLITCFVIVSGVLIWLEARNNKKYKKKVKFNRNVGAIYMGVCLGLYPAIALLFCLAKVFPFETKIQFNTITTIFFLFWLAFSVYGFFIKKPYKINRYSLFIGGSFGVLVPVLNGIQSNIWFFDSFQEGYIASFFVDISWLFLGIISIIIGFKAKPLKRKIVD